MENLPENPHRSLVNLFHRIRLQLDDYDRTTPGEKKGKTQQAFDALFHGLVKEIDRINGLFQQRYGENMFKDEMSLRVFLERQLDQRIQSAKAEFDFQKLQQAMEVMQWKWVSPDPEKDYEVPSVDQLRWMVDNLFERARENFLEYGEARCCSGGFEVGIEIVDLELTAYVAFVVGG